MTRSRQTARRATDDANASTITVRQRMANTSSRCEGRTCAESCVRCPYIRHSSPLINWSYSTTGSAQRPSPNCLDTVAALDYRPPRTARKSVG